MARSLIAKELVRQPWWLLVAMAAVIYATLKYWLPTVQFEHHMLSAIAKSLPNMAWYFSGVIVILAGISFARAWSRGSLLDKQANLNSIKSLTWQEVEMLVGEAYKRKGYFVKETGGAGPDGGVDLVLSKDGDKTLVQCKQRQTAKIGVSVIRELLGSMTAMGASKGVVVCTTEYTQPAKDFARQNNIELLTGHALDRLVASVKKEPKRPAEESSSKEAIEFSDEATSERKCPICEGQMVRRVAKRGKHVGNTFWGCSSFPKCRGTLSGTNKA